MIAPREYIERLELGSGHQDIRALFTFQPFRCCDILNKSLILCVLVNTFQNTLAMLDTPLSVAALLRPKHHYCSTTAGGQENAQQDSLTKVTGEQTNLSFLGGEEGVFSIPVSLPTLKNPMSAQPVLAGQQQWMQLLLEPHNIAPGLAGQRRSRLCLEHTMYVDNIIN